MRKLLLGDWTPVIRDPLDVARLTFVAGAIFFAVSGEAKGLIVLAVASVAVWAARLLLLPRVADLAFIFAMYLVGWGEALDLYTAFPWYDNLVHTLAPLCSAPVAYIALARLDVVPDPKDDTTTKHYWGIFIVTLFAGMAIGAFWEICEWTSDELFGSNLSRGNKDTVTDLIFDSTGSLIGAGLLVLWARYGWGSVRRIPGENRREEVSA